MTRAMCSKTSKRKLAKPSQEVIPDSCKENSPLVTNQLKNKKKQVKLFLKESSLAGNNPQNSATLHNNEGCLRKSERQRKSLFNDKDYVYYILKKEIKTDTAFKRNVLSDKTNSPLAKETTINKRYETRGPILDKSNDLSKTVIDTCQGNYSENKGNSKPHIPIYKTVDQSDITTSTCNLPLEKKETVYEFDEADENEEPVKKRKKKKRKTVRKPKTGPKALTINNIKYSSTESLVSLPEKSVKQKKSKTKVVAPSIRPYTSVNNLNDTGNTCYSVQSFMSHPTSLTLSHKREIKNNHKLSVLQETQSEECQSPIHEKGSTLNSVRNQSESLVNHLNSDPVKMSTILPDDSCSSHDSLVVSHQRCYPSKKSLSNSNAGSQGILDHGSISDTLPNQLSHCSANISKASSHDFLSSTPCKRPSLVVYHNSVFDDSYERDIPIGLRPSTGFIKEAQENVGIDDVYFGFDEPEELEEPLVSPIKNINLQEPRKPHWPHHEFSLSNDIDSIKPNIKEVIQMLKSTIPKTKTKESSQVFSNSDSSSPEHSNTCPSPISKEVESTLSFIKPPRRSYERQRRIRYYSEHEEEEENDNSEQKENTHDMQEQENKAKSVKSYQKKNATKVFKAPKVPIAKQRILKEEEEWERLAVQMNAQFREIDKCNLVVE